MSDKKKSNPLSFESTLRTTLLTMFVVVTVGLAYKYLDPSVFGGPVIVRAEVPDPIGLDKEEPFIPVDITLTLENNTREPMVLSVENPCYIMEWAIFRVDGVFVQAQKSETCAQMIMTASLESGEVTQDKLTILLDPDRYDVDQEYVVIMRFWGHEVRGNFNTIARTPDLTEF